jgi:hypothetical protein
MIADDTNHLRPAVRAFDEQLVELRTQRIRFGSLPRPGGVDSGIEPARSLMAEASALRAAAESATAPVELIRIAKAVRMGRTTYAAVVAGAADHLPEVAAAKAAAREQFQGMVAAGTVRLVLDHDPDRHDPDRHDPDRHDAEPPPTRPRTAPPPMARPPEPEPEPETAQSFLVRALSKPLAERTPQQVDRPSTTPPPASRRKPPPLPDDEPPETFMVRS